MHTAFCIFQDGCSLTLPRRGPLPRHHDVRCPPFSMTSRARFRWLLPSASRARRCVRFNQTTARRNLAIKATRSSRRVGLVSLSLARRCAHTFSTALRSCECFGKCLATAAPMSRESKTHHQLNKSANTARQKNKHASIMPLQCQAAENFHASSDIGGAHRRHQTLSSKWHPGLCPSNCPATSLACSLLV